MFGTSGNICPEFQGQCKALHLHVLLSMCDTALRSRFSVQHLPSSWQALWWTDPFSHVFFQCEVGSRDYPTTNNQLTFMCT